MPRFLFRRPGHGMSTVWNGDDMEGRNIALKLMYNGTAYHGWQVQKNAVTVAETLEKALSTVVCHPVKCTGAGRTDACPGTSWW